MLGSEPGYDRTVLGELLSVWTFDGRSAVLRVVKERQFQNMMRNLANHRLAAAQPACCIIASLVIVQ